MARRDQAPGSGGPFPADDYGAPVRRQPYPLDQPGTRSRPGNASLEESVFFTEQGLKDLAGQLAVYLFGNGSIFGERGPMVTISKRKSDHFEPAMVPVVDTTNNQPTKILERNKARIEAIIINPITNTQTVYVGGSTVRASGPNQGLPIPPGSNIVLDTTIDDIWAIPFSGGGTQNVNVNESVDFGE